ncbi:MAG: selenide, water dikinase SelD [Granulosicoccus sp.]|nr:selenide, water dikinase SelD [Granulosicoccus sp.]
MNAAPMVCDVCLLGGGHSHVLMIRRWAMQPLPGVRLTLVSSAVATPYSGMLPGLIAGHYDVDEMHIDLRRLCTWAGIRFVEQTAIALDLATRQVEFEHRPALAFDVLSLDTGSTPDLSVDGSSEHVTPVKPVNDFHNRWLQILDRLNQPHSGPVSVGVVGSGAGGFELVSAIRHRLPVELATVHWFLRQDAPLSGRPVRVGTLALAAAKRAGINVITRFDVNRVEAGRLIATDGREFELDEILWCTAATGPPWPEAAGLATDSRGFVASNAYLQSISHDFVFAVGDIGTQLETPSAKAGVFAVRQAPYLYENIRRYLLGEPLKRYRPQADFLSLMATGGKRAIASRGPLVIEADWVWRWKDRIDQNFMRKFRDLPSMRLNASVQRLPDALRSRFLDGVSGSESPVGNMRCRGCGAKVGAPVLERVLASLDSPGLVEASLLYAPAGDTAVLEMQSTMLAQSVDHIDAIIDDPYLLGKIAALHALSDVVTVDADVHSAQVMATVPGGSDATVERELRQLMTGLLEVLAEERCTLAGGHSVQGDELSIGIVVNAVLNQRSEAGAEGSKRLKGVTAGDVLIVTKPLGIGTLFAGLAQHDARGEAVNAALAVMLTSNRRAAQLLRSSGARFMTDVTGFGLLGHLQRLADGLQTGARVRVDHVPLLSGALHLARQGVRSSLWPQNRQVLTDIDIAASVSAEQLALLCDPQTGGGLLAIVPEPARQGCLDSLHLAGYADASVIGEIVSESRLSLH